MIILPEFLHTARGRGNGFRLPARFLVAFGLCLVLAGCSVAPPEGVRPVTGFEIDRYLGTWYEVARLDHRFERGLEAVTATYTPREDGGVGVLNRGYDTEEGTWDEARGKAYFTGAPTTGSLKVSFFGPFYGGYHIMALDDSAPDYGYALVSGPSLDYLWILSRTPRLPDADWTRLVSEARSAGFDVEGLIRVDQGRHADPGAEAPGKPLTPP